jgi:ubiquinone/menaquinone biosynthesis C-methylase UbiE
LPAYYAQDFHFQTGGYLTEGSARLYDVQVETLFLGGAAPMRREALRPIAEFMRGRDQRSIRLLDVACGTGRLLRDIRLAYPAMQLSGLDLSAPYLDEARRHLAPLRPATWIEANAEAIPLPDASQDIVTTVFLFHELPPAVRRIILAEMARVLKPGGLLVFIDSLQMGDRPGWDGLLEGFPERFHEPYYRHYAIDDLDAAMNERGLVARSEWTSYFAKVMARTRA